MSNRLAWLLALACGAFLAATLAHSRGAFAQEMEQGRGAICDTAPQMAHFIEAMTGGPQAALEAINKDAPNACGFGHFLFIKGERVQTEKGWAITSILVVAVMQPTGWMQIRPHVYFTAFKAVEREA